MPLTTQATSRDNRRMRWTDLPRDPEPAGDQDRAVAQRGEWEDLRRRLEELPSGHPSSPDGDGDAAEAGQDAGWPEDRRAGERDEGQGGQAGAERRAGGADRGGQAGADRRAGRDGHTGPGRYHAGLTGSADQRGPYRPWFASGDCPEPWFSADPYAEF
jgi:hypothetical protein